MGLHCVIRKYASPLNGRITILQVIVIWLCTARVLAACACVTATFRSEGSAAVMSSDIQTISSFDWHPTSTNRMLVISHSGQVADVYLRERIAMVCIVKYE